MSSVIRINGRVYFGSKGYRKDLVRAGETVALAANTRPDGLPCDGTPIVEGSPDSPLRAGIPYEDEHEQVVYRVVSKLNIAEGWGTAQFWMDRWKCYYVDVLHFVRKGWLDAAIQEGRAVKRFRCRDEQRVSAELNEILARRTALAASRQRAKPAPKPKGGDPNANRSGFRRYDRQR